MAPTQLQKVVIGIDFSARSLAAARWIARHFAPGAELVLVHCVDLPKPPRFLRGRFQPHEELVRTAREGAERRLRTLSNRLRADQVTVAVREGRPAERIVEVATESEADLIVVGEHGRHHGIWDVLGSTAERLVRTSPIPVLLARGLLEGAPRRILVPVDDPELTARVLGWARFLGARSGAEVIALHALGLMLHGYLRAVSAEPKRHEVEEEIRGEAQLWLGERIAAAGFEPERVTTLVLYGDPRHEIIAAQHRYDADLVIMGSGGAGGLRRALLGSVASAVLRGASCPVLVVADQMR